MQQQLAHLSRLPLQHLREQISRHGPFAAGELGYEPLRIRVLGERDGGQAQAGRPSLGALIEQCEAAIREPDPGCSQQLLRLLEREPEIRRTNLVQLAGQPQAMKAEPRVLTRRHYHPHARRQPGQKGLKT